MNTNSVDLRYRNIPLWQSGSLSLMGKYAFANKNDEQERNEDNNSYFRFKDTDGHRHYSSGAGAQGL